MSFRPDVREVVDVVTNVTKSFDFQKIIRDRDYYLIQSDAALSYSSSGSTNVVEYLEQTLYTNASSLLLYSVVFPSGGFSGYPYVGMEVSQSVFSFNGEAGDNIAWWVTDITPSGFKANFSAPYTGSFTYRATYKSVTASYPAYVERKPDLPGSYGWVSANEINLNFQSSTTMSWTALPSTPEFVNSNPVGNSLSDFMLDIGQVVSDVSSSTSVGNDFSIEFSGTLHVVALDI